MFFPSCGWQGLEAKGVALNSAAVSSMDAGVEPTWMYSRRAAELSAAPMACDKRPTLAI
ncbi:hypothetical protein G8764_13515 [Pseudomaricurvus alcaniphilus]|nr:hypothetical protein [Pseudomaricurvus alcaniphilus]